MDSRVEKLLQREYRAWQMHQAVHMCDYRCPSSRGSVESWLEFCATTHNVFQRFESAPFLISQQDVTEFLVNIRRTNDYEP